MCNVEVKKTKDWLSAHFLKWDYQVIAREPETAHSAFKQAVAEKRATDKVPLMFGEKAGLAVNEIKRWKLKLNEYSAYVGALFAIGVGINFWKVGSEVLSNFNPNDDVAGWLARIVGVASVGVISALTLPQAKVYREMHSWMGQEKLDTAHFGRTHWPGTRS